MEYINPYKVFVKVTADFSPDGQIVPRSFTWEDGSEYEIDRILYIDRCASLKAGGFGKRYTVSVMGKQTYIWLEEWDDGHRFFMERKKL